MPGRCSHPNVQKRHPDFHDNIARHLRGWIERPSVHAKLALDRKSLHPTCPAKRLLCEISVALNSPGSEIH
jgi:hypothetical protein